MRQGVFMGKRQRRRFTEAFKQEAVRLCLRHDRSIGQVAREFDLTESACAGGCSSMSRDFRFACPGWLRYTSESRRAHEILFVAPSSSSRGRHLSPR